MKTKYSTHPFYSPNKFELFDSHVLVNFFRQAVNLKCAKIDRVAIRTGEVIKQVFLYEEKAKQSIIIPAKKFLRQAHVDGLRYDRNKTN